LCNISNDAEWSVSNLSPVHMVAVSAVENEFFCVFIKIDIKIN